MCACPAPIPHKPLGNAASCEEACYGRRGGGNSSSNNDAEAARLAREREESERVEREAAEAEQQRLAEEKRLKAEADQKAFIKSRDETKLRGSLGTSSGANSSGGTELRGSGSGNQGDPPLRGSRIDTGIRTGKPNTVERDFSGPNAAWKELFCAASILGPAVAALNIDDQASVKADYSGFKTLASEAINALSGEVKGVPCAKAPELPGSARGSASSEAMVESGKRLVTKAVDLAAKLEKARIQKTGAEAELKRPAPLPPAGSDENVVARQRAINTVRDEEAKRIADAQRNFSVGVTREKEARADLKKIADAMKKAEENPENIGVIFAEVAPPPVTPKAEPTTTSKPTVRRPVRH